MNERSIERNDYGVNEELYSLFEMNYTHTKNVYVSNYNKIQ
jgi:hypothetical protein